MRILVHTCCAPCLIYPYRLLSERGYDVVPYFYNPNVQPFREYRRRYFAAVDYVSQLDLGLRSGPYDMERFLAEVSGDPGDRCGTCYRIRLGRTAREAADLGMREYTTTLLVSPYQDKGMIREAGNEAALAAGVEFVFEDMSDGYLEATAVSRSEGIYMQSYCGCVYSEKERYQKSDPPRR